LITAASSREFHNRRAASITSPVSCRSAPGGSGARPTVLSAAALSAALTIHAARPSGAWSRPASWVAGWSGSVGDVQRRREPDPVGALVG